MILTNIDLWIGKTLFIPPIIKLCQMTGQSQFAISRLLWFLAALDQLRISETLTQKIIASVFSLFMMVSASLRADIPAFSMLWFRMIALAFLALDMLHGLTAGEWKGIEIWILILFAEYATTIRTIPPTEAKKKALKAAEGRSS